jgi:hypothetical protein
MLGGDTPAGGVKSTGVCGYVVGVGVGVSLRCQDSFIVTRNGRAAPSQSLGGSQGGLSELLGGDTPAGGVRSTGVLACGVSRE